MTKKNSALADEQSASAFFETLEKERKEKLDTLQKEIAFAKAYLEKLQTECRTISGNSGVARSQNPNAHSPILPFMIEKFVENYKKEHPNPKRKNGAKSEAYNALAHKCVMDETPAIKGDAKRDAIKKMHDKLRKIVQRSKQKRLRPLGELFLENLPQSQTK